MLFSHLARIDESPDSFIHFWHAPLRVRSAEHRYHFPEWTVVSHVIATFRERLIDFRSCWVVFIRVVWGHLGGLLQFSKGEAVKICSASNLSGICAMWPNREKHGAWTVAESCGCSLFRLTSWVSWCQESSYCSSSDWLKSWQAVLIPPDWPLWITSYHNLSVENASELALDSLLWSLLTGSGTMHWNGATLSWTMMMMTTTYYYLARSCLMRCMWFMKFPAAVQVVLVLMLGRQHVLTW